MPDIYSIPPYPLEQVLDVKKKRVEDAEKTLKEKIKAKEIEEEKLKTKEQERDKVKKHYQDKMAQLRQELDEGTTSRKIDQSKVYIKVVQEKLKGEEKKVVEQKQQVDAAEKNVDIAKTHLKAKQKEQDKIETHKKEWLKETKVELALLQTREEDEIGSTMFLSKYVQKREQKG
jgi:hypothetical protein